ncbi:hypothetical protein ANCDUO_18877, partial [Ancylostoma duodenale]
MKPIWERSPILQVKAYPNKRSGPGVSASDVSERFFERLEKGHLMRDAIIRVCALFVNRCGDFKVYAEYAAAYLRLLQELPSRKDMLASLE